MTKPCLNQVSRGYRHGATPHRLLQEAENSFSESFWIVSNQQVLTIADI